VCGKFLYYARAVDTTMLHALNDLATQTTEGAGKTMEALTHFFNYYVSHTQMQSWYLEQVMNMVLHNHSDAVYLVASKARSRAGGFIDMGNHKGKPQIINGAILAIYEISSKVISSRSRDRSIIYEC
jgi:hypothetical protein